MFRTSKTSRAREAQQVAEQVWDRLATALEHAGDAARSAGRRTHDYAEEAQSRAGAAIDALAGRSKPIKWEWVVGAVFAGLVVGWLAAAGAGRAIATAETKDARTDPLSEDASRPLNTAASPEF